MERIKSAGIFAIGTTTCRSGDAPATLEKAKREPGGSLTLVRHNQRTAPSEGCAVRSLQADGWHIDLLRSCKLIFPNDALVPVGLAFNAVLEHVPCLGEQANDFEEPSFCCVFLIPIRRKLHCLANRKFMGGHSYLSA